MHPYQVIGTRAGVLYRLRAITYQMVYSYIGGLKAEPPEILAAVITLGQHFGRVHRHFRGLALPIMIFSEIRIGA